MTSIMSGSAEHAVEHLEFDLRRAALRDMQLAQAEMLRKSGVLTRALFAAERNGQVLFNDAAYWACVYKAGSLCGVRFISYYADGVGELPTTTIDVPVYRSAEEGITPVKPFDDVEMGQVAAAVMELEIEQQVGQFPDLTKDLTDLIAA